MQVILISVIVATGLSYLAAGIPKLSVRIIILG